LNAIDLMVTTVDMTALFCRTIGIEYILIKVL